jgi:hypothetical protein
LKEDVILGELAHEDRPWPDQLRKAEALVGGRFELKEDVILGALAQEDRPWPDQLREAEPAVGGRFGLKEDVILGELAQEDRPWPDQLREADPTVGGRFEPKFVPGARVPAANVLPKELPSLPPVVPLFILRGLFEPALRPPKKPELLFGREANPPDLLYEPPPFCRGADENPRPTPLPPPCPPPPKWNPPPPPLGERPPP